MIKETFDKFFKQYIKETKKTNLKYVITSSDRQGNSKTNPHAIPGNALDITLRLLNDYAPISEYNQLFAYMLNHWQFRAGIDNTVGNIHIHLDLGLTQTTKLPYFFKEDNQIWQYEITRVEQI